MVFDMCLLGGHVLHWSLVVNWMLELQGSYEIRIYSVVLVIMCVCVHLCVRMCAWAQVSLGGRRGVNYLELDVDAGNRNQVLCKSNVISQPLSHLSSPVAHSFYNLCRDLYLLACSRQSKDSASPPLVPNAPCCDGCRCWCVTRVPFCLCLVPGHSDYWVCYGVSVFSWGGKRCPDNAKGFSSAVCQVYNSLTSLFPPPFPGLSWFIFGQGKYQQPLLSKQRNCSFGVHGVRYSVSVLSPVLAVLTATSKCPDLMCVKQRQPCMFHPTAHRIREVISD